MDLVGILGYRDRQAQRNQRRFASLGDQYRELARLIAKVQLHLLPCLGLP